MNIDTQSLETFRQVVDLIKNIDKYSEIVSQIQAQTTDLQKAASTLTGAKTLAEYETSINVKADRLALERQEFDKACQATNDTLASRAKALDAAESALNDQANFQKANKQLLEDKFAELAQRAVDLDKREQDLNARDAVNNVAAADLAARLSLIRQAGG